MSPRSPSLPKTSCRAPLKYFSGTCLSVLYNFETRNCLLHLLKQTRTIWAMRDKIHDLKALNLILFSNQIITMCRIHKDKGSPREVSQQTVFHCFWTTCATSATWQNFKWFTNHVKDFLFEIKISPPCFWLDGLLPLQTLLAAVGVEVKGVVVCWDWQWAAQSFHQCSKYKYKSN